MDAPVLWFSYLPAQLIIKDFITNKNDCDYEIYMRELMNSSSYFLEKSNQELFTKPQSEEKGQSDCVSSNYSIDFKLLLPETAGTARREFADSIVQFAEGVYGYGAPHTTPNDKKYKPINATNFHAVLRNITYSELLEYENVKTRERGLSRDVKRLLDDMRKPKNLMCLIPYRFFFKEPVGYKEGRSIIIDAVINDYGILFEYRSKQLNDTYETYIAFIYGNHLSILGLKDGNITLCDEIPLSCSKTYLELSKYTLM